LIRKLLLCLMFIMVSQVTAFATPAQKKQIPKNAQTTQKVKLPAGYRPAPPAGLHSEAAERALDLIWWSSRDPYISHYAIYVEAEIEGDTPGNGEDDLKLERIAETKAVAFREEGLEPDSDYAYWVSAVALNGAESEPVMIEVTTLPMTRPPLEMDILEMKNIFSNNYKMYETEGIGSIRIRNNTDVHISRLKVALNARGYMDYPSEHEAREIKPHESRLITIRPVFNNRLLDIVEDTPLQTEISLSYYFNSQLRTFTTSRTVMLYEKHRMIWKDPDMAAVFVTPKDPALLDLSRSIVTQVGDSRSPLVLAGAIFQTLGTLGITYVRDPSNPYQISDGKIDTVDYVQFPVETLRRKSGDCKAMVVLFSSLLESLGIRTIMLDYPGHMFLMFAVTKGTVAPKGRLEGMLFAHDGELWAPVELTMAGASFMSAWEKGSRQFIQWNAKKSLGMMDVRSAWKRYKPATPDVMQFKTETVPIHSLEKRFPSELALLRRLTLQAASAALFEKLLKEPQDFQSLLQIGIIFGEEGDAAEAFQYLKRAAAVAPGSAEVVNNLANLHLLEGKPEMALELYNKAAALDPGDPLILVNIAKTHLKMGNRSTAANIFASAVKMRPDLIERYRGLSLELMR